ncbi:MAG: immunity 42 family protein [Oscillospiraceae bacterium]|nr:immunity 42 family protein [Oscillospiraceae bacterium]
MIFGNPDRFAFLIDKVPEWSAGGYVNGLLYVYVNGEVFPKEHRKTTLSSDLRGLPNYAFAKLPTDERLYALNDVALFEELRKLRYPAYFGEDKEADDDYKFDIELRELSDCGYHIFAISDGQNARIIVGYWVDLENFEFMNSIKITAAEFAEIRERIREYYRKEILGV